MDTCKGIVSSEQVQDIKFHKSGILYIVINGTLIAKREPLDLYIELFRIVSMMVQDSTSVVDVWFSHTPDLASIEFLNYIFNSFTVMPVLHIQSIYHNGMAYEMLRDVGCLADLSRNYSVFVWNWDLFSDIYGYCNYYSSSELNPDYMKMTGFTTAMMDFFKMDSRRSDLLIELCSL